MSLKLFKRLLDGILKETNQYNTVTFPGMGEPLLDETLSEKIEYVRMRGMLVLILTNGYLLSVKRFKQFEKLGVSSVRVSFYGTDRDSYNKAHGVKNENTFDVTIKEILEIAD